jgi:hypothetical protein
MTPQQFLLCALDPCRILQARGFVVDPWQREFLRCRDSRVLLCCSRQAGKSTVVSALALHCALFKRNSLTLLLSPSLRQSSEIFRKVLDADNALGRPLKSRYRSQLCLELVNGSRILCLPGREETIRSYGGVNLLVLDEAARVSDALYRSVRPMLAVSRGRLVALSTPFGQRGWFYREWMSAEAWRRFQITWRDCPRITPEFIEEERASLGASWVAQEYETSFLLLEGLVYPEFATCLVEPGCEPPSGRIVGGIDFGWRNPFAAIWGILDAQDVLWIVGERYCTQTPMAQHIEALRRVGASMWYADPAGASDIASLRGAGLKVKAGDNFIRPGLAAVSARLQSGRLKVVRSSCPQLIHESTLYRYPNANEQSTVSENPIDAHNHALAALRYLIAGIDAHFLARYRRTADSQETQPGSPKM